MVENKFRKTKLSDATTSLRLRVNEYDLYVSPTDQQMYSRSDHHPLVCRSRTSNPHWSNTERRLTQRSRKGAPICQRGWSQAAFEPFQVGYPAKLDALASYRSRVKY